MTTIQPRTSQVTIYQGDYLDNIRHLERQYEEALKSEGKTSRMMSEVPASAALAEQHAALVAEAEESAVTITLRALGRKEWRALVADNPPPVRAPTPPGATVVAARTLSAGGFALAACVRR